MEILEKRRREMRESDYVAEMCLKNNPKFKLEFTTNDMEKFNRVKDLVDKIIYEENGCSNCDDCPDALFDKWGRCCCCGRGMF
jgi:hypothetical protein